MMPEPPEGERPEDRPAPVFAPPGRDMQYGRRYARWAIWGCGGLALALLLLFLGFMLVLLKGPNGKALLTENENLIVCQEHLTAVAGALNRYETDKGRLPARLLDLYPTYLADKKDLRCPSDPVQEEVSYRYRPGMSWGEGDGVVAFCPHHQLPVTLRGLPDKDRPYVVLYIRQDGRVGRMSATPAQIKEMEANGPAFPAPTGG